MLQRTQGKWIKGDGGSGSVLFEVVQPQKIFLGSAISTEMGMKQKSK